MHNPLYTLLHCGDEGWVGDTADCSKSAEHLYFNVVTVTYFEHDSALFDFIASCLASGVFSYNHHTLCLSPGCLAPQAIVCIVYAN